MTPTSREVRDALDVLARVGIKVPAQKYLELAVGTRFWWVVPRDGGPHECMVMDVIDSGPHGCYKWTYTDPKIGRGRTWNDGSGTSLVHRVNE